EPNSALMRSLLPLAPGRQGRFVVPPRPELSGERKGSVHVTVMLNFFDELRQRVASGEVIRPAHKPQGLTGPSPGKAVYQACGKSPPKRGSLRNRRNRALH